MGVGFEYTDSIEIYLDQEGYPDESALTPFPSISNQTIPINHNDKFLNSMAVTTKLL